MKKAILGVVAVCAGISVSAQNYELWGMTQQGGDHSKGVIYKTDSSGNNQVVVHHFDDSERPASSLFQASNGLLYGVTTFGGASDMGAIFSIDPVSEQYTEILDFTGATGGRPRSSFMEASNGMLYIMTWEGGANGKGTIVEFSTTTNTAASVYDFGGSAGAPEQVLGGVLTEVTPGTLFGMTRKGGNNANGTIFKFDLVQQTVEKLVDFDATKGEEPFGSLLLASDGDLYGITSDGGADGKGTIFSYNIALDTFIVEYDLNTSTGGNPYGSLMEASNGKIYGLTRLGSGSSGGLFSFDPAMDSVVPLQTPSSARGTLMQASNGKLYGTSYTGGLFEYDYDMDELNYTFNFTGPNGLYTLYGHLIEVEEQTSVGTAELGFADVQVFPNPMKNQLNIVSATSLASVSIYSLEGKLVLSTNESEVNVDHLAPGTYVVAVETQEGRFVQKLIKE